MRAQVVSTTLILVALVALVVGGVLGYYVSPSKTTSMTTKPSEEFSPSETLVKEQVKYLNEYLKEAASLSGQPAPEIQYSSVSYDPNLGLIVAKGKEKTSGQDVTMYFTKNYKFVGYQTPLDLKSLVNDIKQQAQLKQQQEKNSENVIKQLDKDAYYEGDENAPVTVVVFDDFQCPFCKKFFDETLPKLKEDYIDTGKVKYVFRHFPLSFHQNAQKAAEAAECAGEQGKFWEMHDMLYSHQDALSVDDLKNYASQLGLDTEQFNQCLDSGKYKDKVQNDFNMGVQVGVSGTPTFFINGEKLVGAQPYSVFQQVIDSKLQNNETDSQN